MDKYDLVVIGGGSGGVRAARMATRAGLRTAIVERGRWGGTCVNLGCIPKKFLVYASEFPNLFALSRFYGWAAGEPMFNWSSLKANSDAQIARLNGIYVDLLRDSGVETIEAIGRIVGPRTVEVGNCRLETERILIATGGEPWVPDIPGREWAMVSDDLFHAGSLPQRVAIVGGGYIACEFAGILHRLGVAVEQYYRGELPLRGFDVECRRFLFAQQAENGYRLHCNKDIQAIEKTGKNSLQVQLEDGSRGEFDAVLYATGRRPRTRDIWSDSLEILLDDSGAIRVDNNFQTSVPGIYALGDVIDRVPLTPVALAEAMSLVRHWTEGKDVALDYDTIPTAIFTRPEFASVGLGEERALEQGYAIDVYTANLRSLRNTLTDFRDRVLFKLVVEQVSERLLGVHVVGEDAAEIVQGFAVALRCGARKPDLDSTIGIHPSMAEELLAMRAPIRSVQA